MEIKYKNVKTWSMTVINIELGKLEQIKEVIKRHLMNKYPNLKEEVIYIQEIQLLEINKNMRATTILRFAILYTIPGLD